MKHLNNQNTPQLRDTSVASSSTELMPVGLTAAGAKLDAQSGSSALRTLPAANNALGKLDTLMKAPLDPYAVVHRALRGRYYFTVGLGICIALIGATIGYFSVKPIYRGEGLVRLAYARPAIMKETDQNSPMAMYESFIRSQQTRFSSQTLVEEALQAPAWKTLDVKNSPDTISWFADRLVVEHPPGTEHIRVTFDSPDAIVASTAVRTMIDAFSRAYTKQDKQLLDQRLAVLETRRQQLSERLNTIGSRADQLALIDSLLTEYLKRKTTMENELKALQAQGYMDNHRRVAELRSMLDRTTAMIQEYSQMAHKLHDLDRDYDAAKPPKDTMASSFSLPPPRGAEFNPLWTGDNDSRRDIVTLGASLLQMQRLQADGDAMRKELAETVARMDALKTESGLGGRLEVLTNGDVPLAPFRDKRRVAAVAGASLGFVLPASAFVLLGLLRPQYRSPEDAEDDLAHRVPVIGSVPELKARDLDLLLAAGTAQSVHQIRVRLQRLSEREQRRMFLLTSAVSGEGKTSIIAAIGLSFASSGSRTLLIDFDLVGRRLTRDFKAEHRDGVHEALTRGSSAHCIREVAPNLFVMSAGRVNAHHANTLSPTAVQALLEEVRNGPFDFVLIDSGPVLGSVEVALISPEVDGVVLAVSRGQQPARVERSIQYLDSMNAKLAGIVFNRCKPREFQRSTYASNISGVRLSCNGMHGAPISTAGVARNAGGSSLRRHVIVRSVMTFLPATELVSNRTAADPIGSSPPSVDAEVIDTNIAPAV